MKTFKKVVLEAKNTPSGSYAAGCPTKLGPGCWTSCEIRK